LLTNEHQAVRAPSALLHSQALSLCSPWGLYLCCGVISFAKALRLFWRCEYRQAGWQILHSETQYEIQINLYGRYVNKEGETGSITLFTLGFFTILTYLDSHVVIMKFINVLLNFTFSHSNSTITYSIQANSRWYCAIID
jgi:hypothetical protein